MRRALIVLLILSPILSLYAQTASPAAQGDALNDKGQYLDARTIELNAAASASPAEKAELYWRAARETMELGDLADKARKPQADTLAIFSEGEGYADKAIAADPRNDLAYYWKSANIGRWGQVKGILNSLFKAQPMKDLLVKELSINPDRSDAYYVLGELYRELPGWPVSFGNPDAAVSLGRMAVDLREKQVKSGAEKDLVYNFYTELAKSLYKRNWSAAMRLSEQKNKVARLQAAATPLDRGSFYEAAVTLQNVSDRDEAKAIVQRTVSELTQMASLNAGQAKDLGKAQDVLKGW